MKHKTWTILYDIRKQLIKLYLDEDNKKTLDDINIIIETLTKIIDKNV